MSDREYTIEQLPELPSAALAGLGALEHAGTAPVLRIRPKRPAPAPEPAAPVPAVRKSQVVTRKYLTQVLYPRVICYPFGELSNDLVLETTIVGENDNDLEARARQEQFYKLTSHNGVVLSSPYFCSVRHGPWSALVSEEESCTEGVPNRFTLLVIEIPEIVLVWYGTWEDIPPYPSLHVFTRDLHLSSESRSCCPGFRWCATTDSCIPVTIDCGNPFPA